MRSLEDIKPGQTLGRYEFLVPIAEGGMASVWAARLKGTRGFQKTLAVKMMLASLSDNPAFEQMFLDEARIASKIHHPNVVEIFDLGEETEVLYLVMEFVDGEPLSTIFRTAQKKSGIPVGIAVRVIADAAAGLHAAHELKDDDTDEVVGLVHRDVSPQNILVSYDGTVKIVDFGVAKADGRSAEKTMAGTVKGKAPYMSPEQALGKEIDRRTDVFALGIVLYQLTTGKHPFRGENDIVTLHNIIEKPAPNPSSVVPSYPRPLEAVIMKALEKSPGKRFQSCAELEAALDRVMPPTAPRVRPADVGRFVRETVGDRGEKRRQALRDAVRLADERAQNDLDAAKLAAHPMSEIGLTQQIGSVSVSGIRSELIPTSISNPRQSGNGPGSGAPGTLTPASGNYSFDGRPSISVPPSGSQPSITSMGSSSTTPPPGPASGDPSVPARSRKGLVFGLGAVAAVVLAAVVFTTTRKPAPKSEPATRPDASVMAIVTPPAKSAAPATQDSAPAPTTAAPTPAASADAGDPSATAVAAGTAPHVGGPYDGKGRVPGPMPVSDKDAKDKDAKDAKDKKKPPPSGFVPPPLTDPGF